MCNCTSYNGVVKYRPVVSGTVPEIELIPPIGLGISKTSVMVDACIAHVVKHLWDKGIITLGSCCGHNRSNPSLVLETGEEVMWVRGIISEVDDRIWDLYQWQIITNPDKLKLRIDYEADQKEYVDG